MVWGLANLFLAGTAHSEGSRIVLNGHLVDKDHNPLGISYYLDIFIVGDRLRVVRSDDIQKDILDYPILTKEAKFIGVQGCPTALSLLDKVITAGVIRPIYDDKGHETPEKELLGIQLVIHPNHKATLCVNRLDPNSSEIDRPTSKVIHNLRCLAGDDSLC